MKRIGLLLVILLPLGSAVSALEVSTVLGSGGGTFDPWNTTRWAAWYSSGKLVKQFDIDCNITFDGGYDSSNPWEPDISQHETGYMFSLTNSGRGVTVDGSYTFIDVRDSKPSLGTLYNYYSWYDEDDLFPLNGCFYVAQYNNSSYDVTTIEHLWMKGFRKGIHTECGDTSTRHPLVIDGCQFRHCRWAMFLKSNNTTIQNCGIKRNAKGGVYLENKSYNITFLNNEFQDNNYEQSYLYGDIAMDSSYFNTIQGNEHQAPVISGTFHCGIRLYRNMGESDTLREHAVHHNLICDNTFDGYSIAYDVSSREAMERNYDSTVRDLSYEGRSCVNRNIFENNEITNTTIGFRVAGSGNTIQGNTFSSVSKPIVLHCAFYSLYEVLINDQAGDDVYYWFENSDFSSYVDWFYSSSSRVLNENISESSKLIHAYSQYGTPDWPSYSGSAEVRHDASMIANSGSGFPDISGDKYIDMSDYSLLVNFWNQSCDEDDEFCYGADLNFDGYVDDDDYDILVSYWLESFNMKECYGIAGAPIDIAVGNFWVDEDRDTGIDDDEIAVIWNAPISRIDSTDYYSIIIYDKDGIEVNRCGRSTVPWQSIVAGDFTSRTGEEIAAVPSNAVGGYYPVYIFARGRMEPDLTLCSTNTDAIQDLAAGDFYSSGDGYDEVAITYEGGGPMRIDFIKPTDTNWSASTTSISVRPLAITGGNFSNSYSGDEIAAIQSVPNGSGYYLLRFYDVGASGHFYLAENSNTTPFTAISSVSVDGVSVDMAVAAKDAISFGCCVIGYYTATQTTAHWYAEQSTIGTKVRALSGGQLNEIYPRMGRYEKAEGFYNSDLGDTILGWGGQVAVLPLNAQGDHSRPVFWISNNPYDSDEKYLRVTPVTP